MRILIGIVDNVYNALINSRHVYSGEIQKRGLNRKPEVPILDTDSNQDYLYPILDTDSNQDYLYPILDTDSN